MAVLTESKIRKLLKTDDFKENKRLVLEPGTIITPSAKSYLTNIKIEYREIDKIAESNKVEEESPAKVVQQVKNNRAALQWHLALDQFTSKLLFDQKFYDGMEEKEIVTHLDSLIQKLQDFKQMAFLGNKYFQEDSLEREVQKWKENYSQDSFVPLYTEDEIVLRLYARYVDVRELEIQGTACLFDQLLFEEYHALLRICRAMANDIWLIMIHQIEDKSKERRS